MLGHDFDDFDRVARDMVRRARLRTALWDWYQYIHLDRKKD